MIDAREARDVMMADTPNAFVQTPIEKMDSKDRIVMKITGVLVDASVNDSPEVYGPFVVHKGHKKNATVTCNHVTTSVLQALAVNACANGLNEFDNFQLED